MERLKARAIEPGAVDGEVLRTVGGAAEWGAVPPVPQLVPATTVEAGEPVLLWNDSDELVLVEVTP